MYKKICSNRVNSTQILYRDVKLSLDDIVNNLTLSRHVFQEVLKRLHSTQKDALVSFITDIDSILLHKSLRELWKILADNHEALKRKPQTLQTIAKAIYLENTINALKYLSLLQIFKHDQEHLSLAYMFNKIDHTEVLTNKVILNKDLYEIKEFDGIFISNKGTTLIEVKHTLSKYAFRQIFGYLMKKKNRNKHSHLDIILDPQLCRTNKIPQISNIGIVFSRFDTTLAKKSGFGANLNTLHTGTMLTYPTSIFTEWLHEVIAEKDTRMQIKENLTKAGIRNIFFYKIAHPDIQTIFKQYGDILNKVLVSHTEMFLEPNIK